MNSVLSRNSKYILKHEYEVVTLEGGPFGSLVVGDHYGDPECGIIDIMNRWVISAGCGIIAYRLGKPYEPYEYDKKTDQWTELGRGPENVIWFESLKQIDDTHVDCRVQEDQQILNRRCK